MATFRDQLPARGGEFRHERAPGPLSGYVTHATPVFSAPRPKLPLLLRWYTVSFSPRRRPTHDLPFTPLFFLLLLSLSLSLSFYSSRILVVTRTPSELTSYRTISIFFFFCILFCRCNTTRISSRVRMYESFANASKLHCWFSNVYPLSDLHMDESAWGTTRGVGVPVGAESPDFLILLVIILCFTCDCDDRLSRVYYCPEAKHSSVCTRRFRLLFEK